MSTAPTDGARNLTTIELTNNILDCGKYNSHQQRSTSCVKIDQIKNSSYSVNIFICLSFSVSKVLSIKYRTTPGRPNSNCGEDNSKQLSFTY